MANPSDKFNRASLGTNWTLGLSTVAISGSVDVVGTGTDSSAWWNANTFPSDHFSQITRKDSIDGGGPLVRHQSGANTFYSFSPFSATQANMYEVTAGTFAQLGASYSGLTVSANHTVGLDATGSTLTPYVDGVAVPSGTRSDASITGGAPGVHCSGSTAHFDNWLAGPIAGVTTIFIISGTSQTSPADWNNSNNTVEGIGGGGSGGAGRGTAGRESGGGGAEYRKIANFSVATPGTTAFNYVIGAGGAAIVQSVNGNTAGNAGTDTTFNTSSLIAKAGSAGAGVGTGAACNGGAGGTGGTGASANADGGRGGNVTVDAGASGAGGAGGVIGAGSNGVDSAGTATAGGSGDADFGGPGGAATGANGGNGSEWDATHGSGGGGGGASAGGAVAATGGTGGNYGGGGGAARTNTGTATSGAGKQGIIVLSYVPATAAPFVSGEFPDEIASLLRRDRYGVAMRAPDVRADRLLNLLKSQDQFFTVAGDGPEYQWPNPELGKPFPKDLRGFVNGTDLLLLGKDTFFSAPGQGPDYDWPNPRGRPFPKDLLGFLSSTNVPLLSVAVPFSQDVWPNPMRPYVPVEWRFLNLHATTLSLNAPAPDRFARPPLFGGIVVRLRSNESGTWFVNLLATTLAPIATAPFNQTDWANPRGKPFSIDLRGFIDPFNPNLVGQDTFFGAAGQPPANLDWPNPRGKPYPSDLRTFLNPIEQQLIGQDAFFGLAGNPNFDWPNPKLPGVRDRTTPPLNLLETTLAVPFTQTDWANPRGRPFPVDLRGFVDPFNPNLIGQDKFFGLAGNPNFDWPNPTPQRIRDRTTPPPNLLLSTTSTPAAPPFAQTDWPNPRGQPYAISLRTHTDPLKINLQGQDTFFGAPGQPPAHEWMVPRGRAPINAYGFWTVNLLTTTASAVPFSQSDWPNPKLAIPESRRGKNWPVDLLGTTLATAAAVPFAQANWPNPRGQLSATSLRTHTDPLKLNLQGQDQFFGAPGQPPAHEWVIPRGRAPLNAYGFWTVNLLSSLLTPLIAHEPVPRLGLANRRHRITGMANAEDRIMGLANERERLTGMANAEERVTGLVNQRSPITGLPN